MPQKVQLGVCGQGHGLFLSPLSVLFSIFSFDLLDEGGSFAATSRTATNRIGGPNRVVRLVVVSPQIVSQSVSPVDIDIGIKEMQKSFSK